MASAPHRTATRPAVNGRLRLLARWLLIAALVAGSLALLGLALRSSSGTRDFICYWSSGRLLAAHNDPWNAAAILRLELQAGAHQTIPLIMRNPPWALPLVAPLGYLSAPTAALLWEMMLIAASLASVRLLQQLWPGRIPLTMYLFAPVLACAMAGQSSILLLLGVCLFLNEVNRRPGIAGLALTLLLLKPHLVLLLWLVLLLDALHRRRFQVLGGLSTGTLALSAAAYGLDPHAWTQYLTAMRAEGMAVQFFPNASSALRTLVSQNHVWPQLIPMGLGLVLALWAWTRRRDRWEWPRDGAFLIALSVFVSPYSWLTDQALFLPALFWCHQRASKPQAIVLALLNILLFVQTEKVILLSSPSYLWSSAAWLLWCAWVLLRRKPAQSAQTRAVAVETSLA